MKDRDYRDTNEAELKEDYIIEGYATTFEPYLLFEEDGVKYYEQIHQSAFKNADMSDVILQYDHNGAVFARQSNGTLQIEVDNIGLKVTADLSKTKKSREMYEDVKQKMLTKMSWAFTVAEEHFDTKTRTRNITAVKKIYDTSIVSRPQNEQTSVTAERSAKQFINGLIDRQLTERLEQAQIEYLYTLKRVS